MPTKIDVLSCPKFRDCRGRPRRYVYKRIVELLDGGNALKPPLVKLECGHVQTVKSVRKARCRECCK